MKPKPMPFVIEKLNGMSMITSAAGSPIARSWKSIPASRARVDQQGLADLGHLAPLVQVAGRLADPDERPHRVEEVGEEEGEDPDERGDDAELRERVQVEVAEEGPVAPARDVTPAGPGRGRGPECLVVGRGVDDRRD